MTIDVSAPTGIEQAMRDAIKDECLGAEYGLWTRAIAHLALDKAAIEHNAKMMKLKWAIEEEEAEHRLRVFQNRNQQEITKERMEIYRKIVAAGDEDRASAAAAEASRSSRARKPSNLPRSSW